jgi:methylenetetrahydrofolate dehydrogenase (NADP+)/methenyltetrahydrofolate cyclohydrolase
LTEIAIAARTREEVKSRVAEILRGGRAVHLAAILVGSTPAGELYAQRQGEACRAVGINYELITLPADSPFERVAGTIEKLNHDPRVTGIMLHLPLPEHLDATELQYRSTPSRTSKASTPPTSATSFTATPSSPPAPPALSSN